MTTESHQDKSTASKKQRYLFWALVGISLIIGIQHAISLWYVNDDCFVSFRYAKNFINGHGLVYNAGERVEGFTNFLWTMIIALGFKFNLDPVSFSTTLGICFHACTLLLYGFVSWKSRDVGKSQLLFIPLTAIALSFHHDFNAYATSGMETSLFTFLISATFAILLLGTSEKSLLGVGLLLVIAMMTRPDGIIFLAASCLYLFFSRKELLRSFLMLLLPSVIIFLPYWLIRYMYYEFFFPNTFYAKSIGLPYYSQGITYTLLYFKTYYVFGLIIVLGISALIIIGKSSGGILKKVLERGRKQPGIPHPILLALLFIITDIVFTIRIGGDFMFARFFIAITPMMFFIIEILINKLTQRYIAIGLYALVIICTIFRYDQYGNELLVGYVADESRYYSRESLQRSREDGAILKKYFDGLPVRVAFWASQLTLIYYADPYYAIESSGGLTDTTVAHQEITGRGRPGHEKQPTPDYLVRKKVNFYIGPMELPPSGQKILNAIVFDNIVGRIVVYDNAIMSKLARYPGVHFNVMPEYLDSYIAGIDTVPRLQIKRDYEYFKSFYFDHNSDTVRQQKIIAVLGKENN